MWIGLGVAVLAIFASWFLLPVNEWLQSFDTWMAEFGAFGFLLFAAVYIVAAVVMAPAAPLSMAAGVAFQAWGFPLVIVSATIGASLAFFIARYLMRNRVSDLVKDRPKLRAVSQAVTAEGWKIVMLLRLSPLVPFNLQNYFFGVTEIKFWHYVAATLIGIIPGTALSVYLGAIGQTASKGSISLLEWGLFGIGLITTIIVTAMVVKKAKAKLHELGVDDSKEK
jgi:uncharacterized membrane protein YdjX (TVP38/TMEM64 family)